MTFLATCEWVRMIGKVARIRDIALRSRYSQVRLVIDVVLTFD